MSCFSQAITQSLLENIMSNLISEKLVDNKFLDIRNVFFLLCVENI